MKFGTYKIIETNVLTHEIEKEEDLIKITLDGETEKSFKVVIEFNFELDGEVGEWELSADQSEITIPDWLRKNQRWQVRLYRRRRGKRYPANRNDGGINGRK